MYFDPFTKRPIHGQGIWHKSSCLELENSANDAIRKRLQARDWHTQDHGMTWHRDGKQIVLCLVDDIQHCVPTCTADMPYFFGRDTTVITDNQILCPTLYRVLNLPNSFFGIYAHEPDVPDGTDRQFSFLVNRLDHKRFCILLELSRRMDLAAGYVNFNCQKDRIFNPVDLDFARLRQNFVDSWHDLDATQQRVYGSVFDRLKDQMPMKNHDLDHDQALMRSACNIVIESYSSDTGIAFSEKIFRALVLPRPWMLYGGRYSVARLESLGFDCLRDIMRHEYDALKESENKIHEFVRVSIQRIQELTHLDPAWLRQRCEQAALHNQQLLWQLRHSWHSDLDAWIHAHLS